MAGTAAAGRGRSTGCDVRIGRSSTKLSGRRAIPVAAEMYGCCNGFVKGFHKLGAG